MRRDYVNSMRGLVLSWSLHLLKARGKKIIYKLLYNRPRPRPRPDLEIIAIKERIRVWRVRSVAATSLELARGQS